MRIYKLLVLLTLGLTLFFCAAAQSDCNSKNKSPADNLNTKNLNMNTKNPAVEPTPQSKSDTIKIIAENAYSNIETPFIYVARNRETYAYLQNMVENLPAAATIDFDKAAVVAAFAGTKNTGGYSAVIKKTAGKITVEVAPPPQDAMTTQALTMPYQIALVPVEGKTALLLNISETWQNAVQTYKVTTGKFEYSGGISGRAVNFEAAGTIGILRSGDYVTLIFNLSGKDAQKERKLIETASGKIKDGKIEILEADAGSFSEGPKPPVKVSGTITGDKMSLNFEPLPPTIADGFQVQGNIEAVRNK